MADPTYETPPAYGSLGGRPAPTYKGQRFVVPTGAGTADVYESLDGATWTALGGSIPPGTFVGAVGNSNGTSDVAAIQAHLTTARNAGGGYVRGVPGQTYLLDDRLVIGSGTTLDLSGCKVVLKAGNQKNMLANYSNANPVAVGTGTVALGSNVVTTALAAQAVVGQTLELTGAGASDGTTSYGPLIGNISAVDTGAGTVTLSTLQGAPANATKAVTTTGAAVGNLPAIGVATLSNRDTNINVKGGWWDRGANGPNGTLTGYGANMIAHSIFIKHADAVNIDIDRATSTAGVSFVWVCDISNYSVSVRDGDVVRTAIQINGPAYNGHIPWCRAVHTDDLVSVGTNAYLNDVDTAGDVIGLTWGVIDSGGKAGVVFGSAIRVLAGLGNRVDGINGGTIKGTPAYAVLSGDAPENGHPETAGGTYGDMDLGYICTQARIQTVLLRNPNCDRIKARGVLNRSSGWAANASQIVVASPANIGMLELSFDFTPTAANDPLVLVGSGTVDHLLMDKCHTPAVATNTPILVYLNGGTVNQVTLRDCNLKLSNGQGGSFGYAIWNIVASAVKRVRVLGGQISNGAAVYRAITGTIAVDIKLIGVSCTNMGRLINVSSASAAIYFGGVDCTNNTSAAIVTTGCPLTLDGSISMTTGNTTLVQRVNGTEVVTVNSFRIPIDVSLCAATANSTANNVNAALACGAGPVIANGTTWKHLYTAATYP